MRYVVSVSAIFLSAVLLSGCAAPLLGAGVAGTTVAYKRNEISQALDDNQISDQVLAQLKTDETLMGASHIEVTCDHGVILLVGQTPAQELKDRAASLAQSVPGVSKVYNEVIVGSPTPMSTRTHDSWVTAKVKSQLIATKGLKSGQFKVLTENGVVYLMGVVTRPEADLAVAATREVEGVQKVVKIFAYTSR